MVLLSSTKPTNVSPFSSSFSSISCPRFCNSSLSTVSSFSSFLIRSHLPLRLRSFSNSARVSSVICRSSRPGRPPPHRIDPSPGHLTGFAGALVRLQDRVQIFLAVLFWMSLFFWASAGDGRNGPNKGSRFKKMK
ncbi:hypothetical protein K1719_043274 [Acacia pycnantha]|nr:hypothetical protein K1719_043274 [Acacia pycnantha]